MKNLLIILLTLLVIAGMAFGWRFYWNHQALQLDYARSQNRVAELETKSASLEEERNAVRAEVQGLTDRLAGREAEMAILGKRVEDNEAHLGKMAAELFAANASLRACEKTREDMGRAAIEAERRVQEAKKEAQRQ